jgi:hypothetical protein
MDGNMSFCMDNQREDAMKNLFKILLAIVVLGEMLYFAPNGRKYYINESPTGYRYVKPLDNRSGPGGRHEPDMIIERGPGFVNTYSVGESARGVGPDYPLFDPGVDMDDD